MSYLLSHLPVGTILPSAGVLVLQKQVLYCSQEHTTLQPLPWVCKSQQRVPSFTFPCIFVTPLPDILCAPSVHPTSVLCPPMLPCLHTLKADSTVLVFNSSGCLLCSVLSSVAAVPSRKMPSVLTLLLSHRNIICYVGNLVTLIWLLVLVFCHAIYTSKSPEFLINSFSNK